MFGSYISKPPGIASFLVIAAISIYHVVNAQECIVTVVGRPPPIDGFPATEVRFASAHAIAAALDGSYYFTQASSHVIIRVFANGTLRTVAGVWGSAGSTGDGGPATLALLRDPQGIAVGLNGTVLISDTGNHVIRRIWANGTITTVAGRVGSSGSSGDRGPATSAFLSSPLGLSVAPNGSIYVADAGNHVIRMISTNGNISTVAGTLASSGFAGDGGFATSAKLNRPSAVLHANHTLWIADTGNHRMRRVLSNGRIATVAGGNAAGASVDGGPATSASLKSPRGISLAPDSSILVADTGNHAIRRIRPNNTIVGVAGIIGSIGFSGDGGRATHARLNAPTGVAVDASGNILIADLNNTVIRQVRITSSNILTVAGAGPESSLPSGDGDLAVRASLSSPSAVTVTPDGSLWIADTSNHVIRRVFPDGTIARVAGTWRSPGTTIQRAATSAKITSPRGVALTPGGLLQIADTDNHYVRGVDNTGSMINIAGRQTKNGAGVAGNKGDDGPAVSAQLNQPHSLAVNALGELFIADTANCRIRKVAVDGDISLVAGTDCGFSGDGEKATSAQLSHPRGVSTLIDGSIIIADTNNHRIRNISSKGIISTVAGSKTAGYGGDGGRGTSARLRFPRSTAVSNASLFIADTDNHAIRLLSSNGFITTVAGIGGVSGYSSRKLARLSMLSSPNGVSAAMNGSVLLADTGNNVIRSIIPASRCALPPILNCAPLSPAIRFASTLTCRVTNLAPTPPIFMWLANASCVIETQPTLRSNGTAIVQCPKPANLSVPALLQWVSQLNEGTQLLNGMQPEIYVTLAGPQVAFWGAVLVFRVQSSSLQTLLHHQTTISSTTNPNLLLPCFNTSMSTDLRRNNTANLTCSLLLWSEALRTSVWILRMQFNDYWLPIDVSVYGMQYLTTPSLKLSSNIISARPDPPATSVRVNLPVPVPSVSTINSAVRFPPNCTCGGLTTSLRVWIGSSQSPSCSWESDQVISCVAPPLPTNPENWLARVTVEFCCLYNITSDARHPLEALDATSLTGLLVYDFSERFFHSSVDRVVRLPANNLVEEINIPIVHNSSAILRRTVSTVLLASFSCPLVVWAEAVVVCRGFIIPQAMLSANGAANMSISFSIRNDVLVLSNSVVIRPLPRVGSLSTRYVAQGGCVTVLGDWLTGDNMHSVQTFLGDVSLPCESISSLSAQWLACCIPNYIPPTAPGYPFFRVIVSNNRGMSQEPVTLTVSPESTVTFINDSISYVAMPSAPVFAASPTLATTIHPPLALKTSGSERTTCTLSVATTSCPRLPHFESSTLVGTTTLSPSLPPEQPVAAISFNSVGVYAPLRCMLNIGATCTDGLSRIASAPTSITVITGDVAMVLESNVTITSTPNALLPVVRAILVPDVHTISAVRGNSSALAVLFTCNAAIAPRSVFVASNVAFASTIGLLTVAPCALASMPFESNITVNCSNTIIPPSAGTGMTHHIYVQCIYVSQLDIFTVGPVAVHVPAVKALLQHESTRDGLLLDAFTPHPFLGRVMFTDMSGGRCENDTGCRLNFATAAGRCRMDLQGTASAVLSSQSAAATYGVNANGSVDAPYMAAAIEGLPQVAGSLRMICILWGQLVYSNTLTFIIAPFTVAHAPSTTPLVAMPSSPSDAEFPLPPVPIVSHIQRSISCTLAVDTASAMCPTAGFVEYGVSFTPTTIPPRVVGSGSPHLLVDIPASTTRIEISFQPVGLYAAAGCMLPLLASCRDGIGRSNSTTIAQLVRTPRFTAQWNMTMSEVSRLRVHPPTSIQPLRFVLIVEGHMWDATVVDVWSCDALLVSFTTAASPNTQLSRMVRQAISTGTVIGRLFNDTVIEYSIAGLDASNAPLGATLNVQTECVWPLTGERVRLRPIDIAIPALNISILNTDSLTPTASPIVSASSAAIQTRLRLTWSAAVSYPDALLIPSLRCNWNMLSRSSTAITLEYTGQQTLEAANVSRSGIKMYAMQPISFLATGESQSLVVSLQCEIWSHSIRTDPITLVSAPMQIVARSTLPVRFIPSDSGARWLFNHSLSFGVRVTYGGTFGDFFTGSTVRCSLGFVTSDESQPATVVTPDASVPLSAYQDVSADSVGAITFPKFGIRADFSLATVNATVTCVRPAGDVPPPYTWSLAVIPMRFRLCSDSYIITRTSTPFRVQATFADSCSTVWTLAAAGILPPSVYCVLQAKNDSVVVQGSLGRTDLQSGTITFENVALTAPPGNTYEIQLSCSIGSIHIPPKQGVSIHVELTGCAPGYRVFNSFCQMCNPTEYSLGGGATQCTPCPGKGVSCGNGVLQLQPNYYRPQRQRNSPLDGSSELHPCFNGEACIVNSSALMYDCKQGYTGPLCGVCDKHANYARMGDACQACGNPSTQLALLLVLLAVVAALLTYVALRNDSGYKTEASIVLKITMSYLQAVGSLRAFRAGGTKAYYDIVGWTDVVSANPLSVSALQCIWKPPYLVQYLVTIALPLLASVSVICIFLCVTVAKAVNWQQLMLICRCVAERTRKPFDYEAFRHAVEHWVQGRRHVATSIFVLFITYMSITSASLRTLDCYDVPIDGITYLRSDLSVECYVGQHAAATGIAYVVIVCLGIGFPAFLYWRLASTKASQLADSGFHAAWGFLYDGYKDTWRPTAQDSDDLSFPPRAGNIMDKHTGALKTQNSVFHESTLTERSQCCLHKLIPRHLLWWEAVVLVRKVGIVCLAVLVTNPFHQTAGAAVWLWTFCCLQLHFQPYASKVFNHLELLSLVAAAATSVVSFALLQYDVTDPAFKTKAPAAMTSTEWAITGILTTLNLTTFIILASTWLFYQCRKVSQVTRATRHRFGVSFSRNSLNVLAVKLTRQSMGMKTAVTNPLFRPTNEQNAKVFVQPTPFGDDAASSQFQLTNPLRMAKRDGDQARSQSFAPIAVGTSHIKNKGDKNNCAALSGGGVDSKIAAVHRRQTALYMSPTTTARKSVQSSALPFQSDVLSVPFPGATVSSKDRDRNARASNTFAGTPDNADISSITVFRKSIHG